MHRTNSFCVLILAAGKGTRMHSDTPKVLHKILEEPILYYPLDAVSGTGIANVAVVVGSGGELVEQWLSVEFPEVKAIWQREQLGTGHAVKLAQQWWENYENVVILPGDSPLITAETLNSLIGRHAESGNKCSALSFDIDDPTGYGRIIRYGLSARIVEQRDATPEEAKCREVNSGIYVFDTNALSAVIDNLNCENSQQEYYLPDTLSLISENGGKTDAIKMNCSDELLGINDHRQLSEAATIMQERILNGLMARGVRCADPRSAWVGPKVSVSGGVTLEPNVQIWGSSSIGADCQIGSFTVLRNVSLAERVTIVGSVRINDSVVGADVSIGPFVFIREGTVLSENVHVGRFVEIKKSRVGDNSKIPHLSYIGDTEIGKGTNIGAGTITCNYDGEKKHRTIIGDNCFVGSDTMLVAPVKLGDNSTTGAGSVITADVPGGALGVSRAVQRNIDGWAERRRGKKEGGK